MDEVRRAARAVERVAAAEQGRVLVVSPLGLRGNPHDPDRLDAAPATGSALQVRVGDGHAVYTLEDVTLLHADATSARLAARSLEVVFTAYGSGTVESTSFADAELLVTSSPDIAETCRRTPGDRTVPAP